MEDGLQHPPLRSESDIEDNSKPRPFRIRARTLFVVTVVLIVACVGIVGFVPTYITGSNATESAVSTIRSDTVSSGVQLVQYYFALLRQAMTTLGKTLLVSPTVPIRPWQNLSSSVVLSTICNVLFEEQYARGVVGWVEQIAPGSGDVGYCTAGFTYPPEIIGGAAKNTTMDFYLLNYTTMLPIPGLVVGALVNGAKSLAFQNNLTPYVNVVVPWYDAFSRGENYTRRWSEPYFTSNTVQFPYVVPYIDQTGAPAMFVGAMFPQIMSAVLTELNLRGGSAMLYDNVLGVVAANSWNQPVYTYISSVLWVGNLTTVSDPLMIQVIAALGGPTTMLKTLPLPMSRNVGIDNFGVVYIDADALTDDQGLNMVVVIAMLESAFLGSFFSARNGVIAGVIVALVVGALLTIFIAHLVTSPIKAIIKQMQRAASLRDDSGRIVVPPTIIKEVSELRDVHRDLCLQLRRLKSFVPQGVLQVDPDASSNASNSHTSDGIIPTHTLDHFDAIVDSQQMNSAAREGESIATNPFMVEMQNGQDGGGNTMRHRKLQLNTNTLLQEVNTFTRRFCTLMLIECDQQYDKNVSPNSDVAALLDCIVPLVLKHGGVMELQRPDMMIVSFGAQSKHALHQQHAARCAVGIVAMANDKNLLDSLRIVLDASEYYVGSCGAMSRNARVVFGGRLNEMRTLVHLMDDCVDCYILLSQRIASMLTEFAVIPVDCVQLTTLSHPLVVFELAIGTTAAATRDAIDALRRAFAAMRKGEYNEALTILPKCSIYESHTNRLMADCRYFLANGCSAPYVRPQRPLFDHFAPGNSSVDTAAAPAASGELKAAGDSGADRRHSHRSRRKVSSNANYSTSNKEDQQVTESILFPQPAEIQRTEEAIRETSTGSAPLFEMIGVAKGDIDDDNPTGELPFLFEDLNGVMWTRSKDVLGRGAFSEVYRGMSENGTLVALKCIALSRRHIDIKDVISEVNVVSQLRNENVVNYVSCATAGRAHLAIIMEYVPGGSLKSIIQSFGSLSTLSARRFILDVVRGLIYLHSQKIVHADIKSHNVLVGVDGACKLSDFGSCINAAVSATGDVFLMRGTALYMAPEVARGDRPSTRSDIFSLGMTLLEMLTGEVPWMYATSSPQTGGAIGKGSVFDGADAVPIDGVQRQPIEELKRRDAMFVKYLGRGEIVPRIPQTVTDDNVVSFIRACTHANPMKRPAAVELLSYPFLL